jgi:hypothetical protein
MKRLYISIRLQVEYRHCGDLSPSLSISVSISLARRLTPCSRFLRAFPLFIQIPRYRVKHMQTPLQHAVAIKVGVYLKLVGEVENKWILTYFGAYSVRKVPADKIPASLPSSTRNLVFAAREFSSMLLLLCHE